MFAVVKDGAVWGMVDNMPGILDGTTMYYPVIEANTFDPAYQYGWPHYSVNEGSVTVIYTIMDKDINGLKTEKISQIYEAVAGKLNSLTQGYSSAEIATWPLLQADIVKFNVDATIGSYMAQVIAQGVHSAAGLSAILTPKITLQNTLLTARGKLVNEVNALTTPKDVAEYKIILQTMPT